jgi:anti-sigma B factor antagonist
MALELSTRALPGNSALLLLRGGLDAVAAPAIRAHIQALVEQGRVEIVCDLNEVDFLDSSGLSALVSALKTARERGGFLKLVGLKDQVAGAFKRTMLDRVFEIYPTVEAALA